MPQMLQESIHEPYGCVNSDWTGDTNTHKSVSGLALMLAGRPIAYKSKSQPTIAYSTTEVEFTTATDYAKTASYLRPILKELGLEQENTTVIYEDDAVAIEMANARKPARSTRHVDIKYVALLRWCKIDQSILSAISTSNNSANGLTKSLATTLFTRHADTLLSHRKPQCVTYCIPSTH